MARITKAHAGQIKAILELARGDQFKGMREFLATVADTDNVFFARDRRAFNKKVISECRTVLIAYTMMALYIVAAQFGWDSLTHTLNSFNVFFSLRTVVNIGKGIIDEGLKWFKSSAASTSWTKFTSIGLLIGAAITWGMFAYSFFTSGIKPGSLAGNSRRMKAKDLLRNWAISSQSVRAK